MRALVLGFLIAAGCGLPAPEVESEHEAILGGSADAGVGIKRVFLIGMTFEPDAGSSICSATLVGPHSLATAAHCVDPVRRGAASVTIIAVDTPTDQGVVAADVYHVTEYRLDPQWDGLGPESADEDIAMLLLDRAPPLSPWPIARSAPVVGQAITLVGYGRDDPNDGQSSGTRRAASASITAVDARSFEFGVSAALGVCGGDSGGPSLSTGTDGVERVVGLHSTTVSSTTCGDGADTRIDVHAAFIDDFLAQKDPVGVPDAGAPDAGVTDAGAPDAGHALTDAGVPDGGHGPRDAGGDEADGGAPGGAAHPCGCAEAPLPLVLAGLLCFRRRQR